jgi:hypothetical protein
MAELDGVVHRKEGAPGTEELASFAVVRVNREIRTSRVDYSASRAPQFSLQNLSRTVTNVV